MARQTGIVFIDLPGRTFERSPICCYLALPEECLPYLEDAINEYLVYDFVVIQHSALVHFYGSCFCRNLRLSS